MAGIDDLYDSKGHLLCRYCRFAHVPGQGLNAPWTCKIGDNPGPVDPDTAECFEGELDEMEMWERRQR